MSSKARQAIVDRVKLNMSSSYSTQNFICRLCHGVLKDPQQTTCCGSHFCLKCIGDRMIFTDGSTCPECNKEEMRYFQDIHFGRVVKSSTRIQRDCDVEKDSIPDLSLPSCEDGAIDCRQTQNHNVMYRRSSSQPYDRSTPFLSNMKEVSDHLLKLFSDKLDTVSKTYEMKCAKLERRQEKVEEMLEIHKKVLQTLCSKVEALQNQIRSHALLPYSVTVPNIDSYFDGRQGDEWNSPEFYTGTLTSRGYKLQLSIVPYSLYTHNKQKALSARLLIAKGEEDDKLTWPFQATYKLVFSDPSDTEMPYIVVRQHTWESPRDETSMHFQACITHKDLLKYVKHDNCLHVCIQDH